MNLNKFNVLFLTFNILEHGVNYNVNEKNENQEGIEPKFMDTINPLLSFSNTDLAEMNQEFDQFFNSDESSSDDEPVDMGK